MIVSFDSIKYNQRKCYNNAFLKIKPNVCWMDCRAFRKQNSFCSSLSQIVDFTVNFPIQALSNLRFGVLLETTEARVNATTPYRLFQCVMLCHSIVFRLIPQSFKNESNKNVLKGRGFETSKVVKYIYL